MCDVEKTAVSLHMPHQTFGLPETQNGLGGPKNPDFEPLWPIIFLNDRAADVRKLSAKMRGPKILKNKIFLDVSLSHGKKHILK